MDPASLLDLHVTDRADRVREHTGTAVQVELDEELVARLRHYAGRRHEQNWAAAVTARIVELEQEPDVERTL